MKELQEKLKKMSKAELLETIVPKATSKKRQLQKRKKKPSEIVKVKYSWAVRIMNHDGHSRELLG